MRYVVITAGSTSGAIPIAWLQSMVSMCPPSGLPPGEGQVVESPAGGRCRVSGMRTGLTIGEFATVTRLSVRTLRRYHEAGLLEPTTVDPFTGYRYYSADQIPPAQVIHQLRELDVPLAEVRAILAADDPQQRTDLIAGHLRRLED